MDYGRYHILEELGKGAMGVVYKAHDPQIDRVVALKVLRHDRVTSEDFVQRFLKEAKAIGRLSHPNIVTVYDVGQDHGTIYIAMEFLEGTPLNEAIEKKDLNFKEIINLGIQVADALDYAHQQGIIHRDIKPANIILTPHGRAKITDFGIARIEDPFASQQTQAGEILGTPAYMSPEQVTGKAIDGSSDLYSLGVILYELLVGEKPFRGDGLAAVFRAITQDVPTAPEKIDTSVHQGLSKLVMKSLNKIPNDRFHTGNAMAEALKACLHEEELNVALRESGKKRSKYLIPFLLMIMMMLSITGAFFYFTDDTKTNELITPQKKVEKVRTALLKVDSTPVGAQVFINGSFKGKTPVELEVPSGKHEIRLNLPHYYEWEAQLQLNKDEKTPLFVRLVPIDEKNH